MEELALREIDGKVAWMGCRWCQMGYSYTNRAQWFAACAEMWRHARISHPYQLTKADFPKDSKIWAPAA